MPEVADVIVFEAVSDAALDEGEPEELAAAVPASPEPVATPLAAAVNGAPPVDAPAPVIPVAAALQAAAPAAAPSQAPAANKHAKGGSSTVRVDAERLDQLMHFMGELVLHRTQVEALAAGADVPGLSQAMQNLTRSSHALQSMVMQVRMIPVEAVFLRFPRLVRDLSTKLRSRSSSTSSARTPSSTAPSSTRSATRSCTSSATRSTTASRGRTSAWPRASPRPAR